MRVSDLVHLTGRTFDVVVDVASGTPTIVHWGAPLGTDADLANMAGAIGRPPVTGALGVVAPISLIPLHADGFPGRPGLEGRRGGGRAWAPRFGPVSHRLDGRSLIVESRDDRAELTLVTTITVDDVLAVRVELTNTASRRYSLDALRVTLPVPSEADELLRFEGRWARELQPTRSPWTHGAVLSENRRGRTSHEHPPLVFVGTNGFGEWAGEVWGMHVAWSGNHTMLAERLADGRRYVQGGELLHPGEVVLEPGETYATPSFVGVYSDHGLTPASWGFHRAVRSSPVHPTTPRPVLLNTWEAVYFDHDGDRLRELADVAAAVGVERFVLDDGWFGSRRDDTSGLGDWWVSPEVYPNGLTPLIDHVTGLGMEFGIWVEPEMVSLDSDLYRDHPDWALVDDRYPPVLGRYQLVLDVGRADVRDHLFEQLDCLLREHDIAYLKWDHNRDLVAPASNRNARAAGVHRQTLGLYDLLTRLRAAHPDVEIEACASGGGRVDFGVLEWSDRVWTSDSIDALDRLSIQRGFSLLFPPELMGSHVGAPVTHSTRRQHRLGFRGATALFGAFGVEWNLLDATPDEREQLAAVIALHRHFRMLLHTGDVVRCDHADPTVQIHGVIATDRSEALIAITRLASGPSHHTTAVRIPYLADDAVYEVRVVEGAGDPVGNARRQPDWIDGKLSATGRQLGTIGFRAPQLDPESTLLVHLGTTLDGASDD